MESKSKYFTQESLQEIDKSIALQKREREIAMLEGWVRDYYANADSTKPQIISKPRVITLFGRPQAETPLAAGTEKPLEQEPEGTTTAPSLLIAPEGGWELDVKVSGDQIGVRVLPPEGLDVKGRRFRLQDAAEFELPEPEGDGWIRLGWVPFSPKGSVDANSLPKDPQGKWADHYELKLEIFNKDA